MRRTNGAHQPRERNHRSTKSRSQRSHRAINPPGWSCSRASVSIASIERRWVLAIRGSSRAQPRPDSRIGASASYRRVPLRIGLRTTRAARSPLGSRTSDGAGGSAPGWVSAPIPSPVPGFALGGLDPGSGFGLRSGRAARSRSPFARQCGLPANEGDVMCSPTIKRVAAQVESVLPAD